MNLGSGGMSLMISVMGGELIIKARFPDREVIVNRLSDLLETETQ